MSTRSSIFYSEEKDKDYHIYIEMLDDTICIELHRGGMTVTAEIMTLDEWRSLGLPTSVNQPGRLEALSSENATLRAENARLADEVRRLEYSQIRLP